MVANGQTQEEVDKAMKEIVYRHPSLLTGLGDDKGVELVHIYVDSNFRLVQQKRQPIHQQYQKRFRD